MGQLISVLESVKYFPFCLFQANTCQHPSTIGGGNQLHLSLFSIGKLLGLGFVIFGWWEWKAKHLIEELKICESSSISTPEYGFRFPLFADRQ